MYCDLAYAVKMRMQQKYLQYLVGSVLHWTIVEYLFSVGEKKWGHEFSLSAKKNNVEESDRYFDIICSSEGIT
jgi:hypothetical protein